MCVCISSCNQKCYTLSMKVCYILNNMPLSFVCAAFPVTRQYFMVRVEAGIMRQVVLWDTAYNFNGFISNQSIFNCLITGVPTLISKFYLNSTSLMLPTPLIMFFKKHNTVNAPTMKYVMCSCLVDHDSSHKPSTCLLWV